MKKIIFLISVFAISLTACSNETENAVEGKTVIINNQETNKETISEEETSDENLIKEVGELSETDDDGYYLLVNDTKVFPTQKFSEVKDKLGEPLDVGVAPSCVFEGEDKSYKYDNFNLLTGVYEGEEVITGILVEEGNENFKTPENIGLGSTFEELKAAYGEDFISDLGKYTYSSKNVDLTLIIEDEKVIFISYIGKFE